MTPDPSAFVMLDIYAPPTRYAAMSTPDKAAYRRRARAERAAAVAAARRLGLLAELPSTRQTILDARWPEVGAAPTKTLAELAAELDLSRERVRQIEVAALSTLRYLLRGWTQQEVGLGVARCPFGEAHAP